MSCEHEVRFTIKPTDDACRFHFDVRAYKDRIVAPDEYSGATEVTPSHIEQVLPTTDKLVREDITVLPAPTEYLSTDHNGTFTPSDGKVGFYQVDVDVNPDLRPLSVSENGQYSPDDFDGYSDVTVDVEPNLTSLAVTENGLYLPESGVDGFDRVNVDVPVPSGSTTITQNGTYNVEQYASAVVDVLSELDINNIADGSEPSGAITLDAATRIRDWAFYKCSSLTAVTGENVETIGESAFYNASNLQAVRFSKCKAIGNQAFRDTKVSGDFASDFPIVESIGDRAFQNAKYVELHLPASVKTIATRGFNNCFMLAVVYFRGTPTSIGSCFDEYPSPHITDIYVPWSQGEVSGAPWGATHATIHYNTIYDENWNVISST